MIDYRSKLLGYSSRPTQRADEWTLMNQHKSLEEEKAKIQEQRLEEEKKRQLAYLSIDSDKSWRCRSGRRIAKKWF